MYHLVHQDKLFRRVKDERGNLMLSQAASEFHPGQGVYRSSYMNARRLAVTGTNMAYRTADHMRHQQMDFVVGIEVKLSNNHNCKGVPAGAFYDICDELQGKYPKDFMSVGWHPHCRCHAETILKTKDEVMRDIQRQRNGEEPLGSQNEVKGLPYDFVKWLYDDQERAKRSNSIPYFISDNKKYMPKGYIESYGSKAISIAWKDEFAKIRKQNRQVDEVIITKVLQKRNHKQLEEYLNIKQGEPMLFDQADGMRVNPNFGKEKGYGENCQTCTIVYELRRRGFDIEAKANRSMGNNRRRNGSNTEDHIWWLCRIQYV